MATKLKDFVTKLAKKAGYDTASDGAKAFLESLNDVEVPEDVEKGIDNSLISLTEAKNNFPELKNHYTKQALDGMDKEFMTLIEDFQVDEPTKAEILAEKSTYKRGPLLTRRIVELERKKLATTGGKDCLAWKEPSTLLSKSITDVKTVAQILNPSNHDN